MATTRPASTHLSYLSGFGNIFASEAEPGALPIGRNSPQRAPLGLYAELLSGTAFTAPRKHNLRTWMYRIRPSARHGKLARVQHPTWLTGPFSASDTPCNRLRWNPWPMPAEAVDFVQGMFTVAGNGQADTQSGVAAHVYRANRDMNDCYFSAERPSAVSVHGS